MPGFQLPDQITSALLHYQLLATFGTPEETLEVDGYKGIWQVDLYWQGDSGWGDLNISVFG